jgi:hypothetical protein
MLTPPWHLIPPLIYSEVRVRPFSDLYFLLDLRDWLLIVTFVISFNRIIYDLSVWGRKTTSNLLRSLDVKISFITTMAAMLLPYMIFWKYIQSEGLIKLNHEKHFWQRRLCRYFTLKKSRMPDSTWAPPFVNMVTFRNTFEVVFPTYDGNSRDGSIDYVVWRGVCFKDQTKWNFRWRSQHPTSHYTCTTPLYITP